MLASLLWSELSSPVSTAGAERVSWEQTLGRRCPFRSDLGVYLAAVGRDHGRGETADAVVLLGNGGAVEEEEEAGVGAEVQGGAVQDEVEVSSERSGEGEEGHVSGSLERSRGLRRGREGE